MTDNEPIHYVYLLVDRDNDRFKIGVSIKPKQRSFVLKQKFNLSMSMQAGFTKKHAYAIERYLHRLHQEEHIDPHEMGWVDGRTEWFSFACFPSCYRILRELDAVVPLHRIRPKPHKRKDWMQECMSLLNDPAFMKPLIERYQASKIA